MKEINSAPENAHGENLSHYCLCLSYDGTDFCGFQRQPEKRTVQGALERALQNLYGYPVGIHGAGRTDAGAHARGQAASFKAPVTVPTERLPQALNRFLPPDIRVWAAQDVPQSFHARYSAQGKKYSYTIDQARVYRVLERRYAYHLPEGLHLDAMTQGGEVLQGTHDFRAFQAVGSPVSETVRTLWQVKVIRYDENHFLRLEVTGNGFLYKMVRFIAGALIEIGRGKLSLEDLTDALQPASEQHKGRKWPALPARGLCLEEVYY